VRSRNVFTRLAELSVHGANVQGGKIVLVQAEIGLEEQARSTAEAAYERGAQFVDVAYFDPWVKRVRIESADPDTLDVVPKRYGERVLEHAEQHGARISIDGEGIPVLRNLAWQLPTRDTPVSVASHGEGYQW
jgi:aminopeptidase